MLWGSLGRIGAIAATLSAAASVACSSDDDEDAFDCTVLPVCDIRQPGCQSQIYQATACARAQPAGSMPAVRTITSQVLEEELRQKVGNGPNMVPLAWDVAIQLFGLIPERSITDVVIESTVSNAAAFYDPTDKLVSVIEDNSLDPENASWILSHEFVHALQDEAIDLRAFDVHWSNSTDDNMVVTALIEGEAMLHPNVLRARKAGLPPGGVSWERYSSSVLESVLMTVETAPSPFVDAVNTLPYPIGFSFLIDPWLARGQAAVDGLIEAPPFPFVDWVLAFDGGVRRATEQLTCFPTGAPPGFSAFDHDSLGVTGLLGLRVALGASGFSALNLAKSLHDDSLVVFTNAPEPTENGVAAAWRWRLQDAESASSLVLAIESARSLPFENLLVQQFDREVLVRTAVDPAVLSAWTNAGECGRAEDLPTPSERTQDMSALIRRVRTRE